jgi:hypothetical protein
MRKFTILLSFDIEEFDTPLEYNRNLPWKEQVAVSKEGTEKILTLLRDHGITATFYSTVSYAKEIPGLLQTLSKDGHELASHGMEHSAFSVEDLARSRSALQELSGSPIHGYRMARMMPVDEAEVNKAGYLYNSSLNPTFLPGRYNNFRKPRTIFQQAGICQFPASVSTWMRVPLFWMSFHNLPFALYKYFCKRALQRDSYLHLYFHPWEFCDIRDDKKFGLPFYVKKNCGEKAVSRLHELINWLKEEDATFETTYQFLCRNGSISQTHK